MVEQDAAVTRQTERRQGERLVISQRAEDSGAGGLDQQFRVRRYVRSPELPPWLQVGLDSLSSVAGAG